MLAADWLAFCPDPRFRVQGLGLGGVLGFRVFRVFGGLGVLGFRA